jgi:hypothetical protein
MAQSITLELTNPIAGDGSITVSWTLTWNGISAADYTPVSMQINLNDSPTNNYNFTSADNKHWSVSNVPNDKIGDSIYTITGLANDENYLIYGFMAFRQNNNPTNIITVTSAKIGPITPLANPTAITITDPTVYNGKIPDSNTSFNIQIEIPSSNNYASINNPDYLMIMLIDNANSDANVQTRTIKVPWTNLDPVSGSSLLRRYTLTELVADKAYECAAFVLRGYQVSTLSNTIPVVATQKASVPGQLSAVFKATDGDVTISSTINEKGATPEDALFKVRLYTKIGVAYSMVKEFTVQNVFDGTNITFPYTFSFDTLNLLHDNSNLDIFNIGTSYTIALSVHTAFGETEKSSDFTFTPVRRLESPTVKLVDESDAITEYTAKITWTLPDLYGQTVSKYTFYKTTILTDGVPNFTGVTGIPVTTAIKNYTYTGLTVSTKYYFAMTIAVTDPNPNPDVFVDSVMSDELVFATTYNAIDAPTMTISYIEADVNGQAKLSWSDLTSAQRDNLTVTRYIIYSTLSLESTDYNYVAEVTVPTVTYTKTGLTNGTTYYYAVAAEVTTLGSNSYVSGDTNYDKKIEGAKSATKSIVPWSKPSPPTLSDITNYGNHWAQLFITDNKTPANGLVFKEFLVNMAGTGYDQNFTFINSPYYATGLPNGTTLTASPYAKYDDPNILNGVITTSVGTTKTVEPVFKDEDWLSPTNVTISNIGDNSATVNWTAPTFTISGLNQQLTLSGYIIQIFNSSTTAVITTENLSTSTLTYTYSNDTNLVNGNSFTAIVSAVYDDAATTGTQILYAPSEPSSAFIPHEKSNPVTSIVYTNIGDQTVTLDWTVPTYTGGNNIPINRYECYYEEYSSSNVVVATSDPFTVLKSATITGLTNGNNYKFYIRVVTKNPNDNSTDVYSDYTSTTTNAYPFAFNDTLGAIANFDVTFINSDVTLGWNANTSLQGYPFDYLIHKRTGTAPGDYALVATIANTASPSTSYTSTGLTLGTSYVYKAQIKFVNPNDVNDIRYGPFTHVEDAIPYNNPSAPQNLVGTPGDAQVSLQWTRETTVNGLPVQGYNIYHKISDHDGIYPANWTLNNSSYYADAAAYVKSGLTNGNGVKFVVRVVTKNTNDDTTTEGDAEPNEMLESGDSNLITVWPFRAPAAPVITVNITEATDSQNKIYINDVTNTGGFDLAGYNVYLSNNTKLNTSGLVTSSPFIHSYLTNGTSYSYYVKAVVLDKNNSVAQVESVASDTVTKIPFKQSNAPVITSVTQVIEETMKLDWTFTNNYTAAGLINTDDKFVITMENLSQPERNTTLIETNIDNRTLDITVIPGHTYRFTMVARFQNPNDTDLSVDSNNSNSTQFATFGYADAHIEITENGNGQVKLLINRYNDLDKKGGVFSNYYILVKDELGIELISEFIPIKENDETSAEITITGLTNGTKYRIEVITETYSTGNPNIFHYGDTVYCIAEPGVVPVISNFAFLSGAAFNYTGEITFAPNVAPLKSIMVFIEKYTPPSGSENLVYKQLYQFDSPLSLSDNKYTFLLSGETFNYLSKNQINRLKIIARNAYGNSNVFSWSV